MAIPVPDINDNIVSDFRVVMRSNGRIISALYRSVGLTVFPHALYAD